MLVDIKSTNIKNDKYLNNLFLNTNFTDLSINCNILKGNFFFHENQLFQVFVRFSIFFTSSRDDLGLEENEPIKYNLHQINIFLSCGFYKYINYLKQSRHI